MYQERRVTKSVTVDKTRYTIEFMGDGFRVKLAGMTQIEGWVWERGTLGNVTLYIRDFRLTDQLCRAAETEAKKLAAAA